MSAATVAIALPAEDLQTIIFIVKGQIIAVESQMGMAGLSLDPSIKELFESNLTKSKLALSALARAMTPADGILKPIMFAASHLLEIQMALEDRTEKIENQLARSKTANDEMFWRDHLDVAEQALDLVIKA